MKKYSLIISLILFGLILNNGCSTSLDINATEKPILVVYGVLNPKQPIQYIRVSKGFLVDGDAVKYASETDLSASNAKVTLTEYLIINNRVSNTPSKIYELVPETSIPKEDGFFNKNQILYKTQPSDTIRAGRYYELEVKLLGNETLSTKAHTIIPSEPFITAPTDKIQVGQGNVLFNYPEIEFYNSYEVKFFSRKNTNDPNEFLTIGRGYELRIYFKYGIENSPGDTVWQPILRFGPTQPFDKSSCTATSGQMCYRIGAQSFTDFLRSRLTDNTVKYVYNDTPLNESTRLEITSIDTALFNYLQVNSPVYSDFNVVKPEYTNLSNGALGILGSINTFSRFVNIGNCTKHLVKLNNTPKPGEFCK